MKNGFSLFFCWKCLAICALLDWKVDSELEKFQLELEKKGFFLGSSINLLSCANVRFLTGVLKCRSKASDKVKNKTPVTVLLNSARLDNPPPKVETFLGHPQKGILDIWLLFSVTNLGILNRKLKRIEVFFVYGACGWGLSRVHCFSFLFSTNIHEYT